MPVESVLPDAVHPDSALVKSLISLWTSCYTTDLSMLSSETGKEAVVQLVKTSSSAGRSQTVKQLKRILQNNCERAGIQSNTLFSYIPNVVHLSDAQRIAVTATHLYEKTLEFYEQQSPSPASFVLMPSLSIQAIPQLLEELEPVLQELRHQHLAAKDSRAIAFLSTQFHFSSQFLLNRLTPVEQLLVSPYFRFLEEQVCIPWKRVCEAATGHTLQSPKLSLIQQMLPRSRDIALSVSRRVVQLNPHYQSQRGLLSNPGVMASSIRDVQMFQSYLWLSILEGSTASIEKELVPLCVMVYPSVNVSWKLARQGIQILMEELQVRMQPEHVEIFLPYAQSMQHFFAECDQA
ncbi:MAG: hypothetical protein HC879_10085 [Leptolyngbyaceae cyanobacterium SL_5_9]|nr:hypothetical protein [Leptolyngbyaceae cyanobacterium SL_5_9]NJO73271.1 hypothetical protein [Leptolyngbyaceae cyanobacterium RM1_406_9]